MSSVSFVGSTAEVAHHAAPLSANFDVRIVPPDQLLPEMPADLYVFYNEFFDRFRNACGTLRAEGAATLYAVDGLLEWRNAWDFPGVACLWTFRPVLSDKIACIGRSQARILESWGNLGKCEVVGVPRFDRLLGRKPRVRPPHEPWTVLIMTAKTPGFTADQVERATNSLADLKGWFEQNSNIGKVPVRPRWRVTAGLDDAVGVPNELRDTTGEDLATALEQVDAVITTPSTAMLEAMLQGVPVALLDYNNCPHYVPAAWTITAPQHLDQVIPELLDPPQAKMLYQDTILHDNLECRTPATPRMVRLVEEMVRIGRECRERNQPLQFPRRILADDQDGHHLPEERFDLTRLYPSHPVFANMDRATLQAHLGQIQLELQSQRVQCDSLATQLQTARQAIDRVERHPVLGPALRCRRIAIRFVNAVTGRSASRDVQPSAQSINRAEMHDHHAE